MNLNLCFLPFPSNLYRRTLAVVSGALIAGGTLAYTQSGRWKRQQKENSCTNGNAHTKHRIGHDGTDGKLVKPRKKKSGLKSLHFLAAILLKKIGPNGSNYLLGLIITAVSYAAFTICSCQLFVILIFMLWCISKHACNLCAIFKISIALHLFSHSLQFSTVLPL